MKKRMIFALLAALLAVLALSGCSDEGPVPSGCLRIDGKDVRTDWVMKVDGKEVSADEYRYFFMNVAYEYSGGYDTYAWSDEENEAVVQSVLEYVVLNRALFDLAEGYGLSIDGEDRETIQADIKKTAATFESNDEYLAALESTYITEEYYPTLLESTVIQQKLSDFLLSDGGAFAVTPEEMLEKVENEYVCVRYLMLSADGEGSTANRDRIAEYASRITDKDSLITFINLYSDAVSMKNNADGIYISAGMADEELVRACFDLEIGEISPVVECSDGYYIILRQEFDSEYVAANIDAYIEEYQESAVKKLLTDESADSVVEYNEDIYKKISVYSMS